MYEEPQLICIKFREKNFSDSYEIIELYCLARIENLKYNKLDLNPLLQ